MLIKVFIAAALLSFGAGLTSAQAQEQEVQYHAYITYKVDGTIIKKAVPLSAFKSEFVEQLNNFAQRYLQVDAVKFTWSHQAVGWDPTELNWDPTDKNGQLGWDPTEKNKTKLKSTDRDVMILNRAP